MREYDVVVVGAGPSGSTVARECATHGLSVLRLDKSEFHRDKPCGGGVTVRTLKLLPFSIDSVVERVVTDAYVTLKHNDGFVRHSDEPMVHMTQRRNFDALLVERSLERGVTLKERVKVVDIERDNVAIRVKTHDEKFRAKVLVAADGANGTTSALSGVRQHFTQQVALEGNITPQNGVPTEWETRFGLDFGELPGGYGWIFPKGDHVNIGVVGWRHAGPQLRDRMFDLVKFYGYDPENVQGLRGHYINIRQPDSTLVDGNFLLVGDAAGLVDPITDEGIYSAIWSGKVAAKHIIDYVEGESPDLSGYMRQVEAELLPDLKVSQRFHDLFHISPGLYLWIDKRTSILWGLARHMVRGDQTYVNVMLRHKTTGTIIDFLSALVRVTPFLQRRSGLRDPAPPQRFFVRESVQP